VSDRDMMPDGITGRSGASMFGEWETIE